MGRKLKKKKKIGVGDIQALRILFIYIYINVLNRPPWWLSSKDPPATQETWVQSLGREDPLEEDMTTHSSIPAWRNPWTKEPSGL